MPHATLSHLLCLYFFKLQNWGLRKEKGRGIKYMVIIPWSFFFAPTHITSIFVSPRYITISSSTYIPSTLSNSTRLSIHLFFLKEKGRGINTIKNSHEHFAQIHTFFPSHLLRSPPNKTRQNEATLYTFLLFTLGVGVHSLPSLAPNPAAVLLLCLGVAPPTLSNSL